MNAAQLNTLSHQLSLMATALVPGAAPTVAIVVDLVDAATSLAAIVREIRDNPDTAAVWAQVTADYADAVDAFRAGADRE